MRKAGIVLGISAMLAGCASHPENAALAYRQEQLRNQPTVLSSARPAEMPEGRGPLETPPPSETPDLRTAAVRPTRYDVSSPGGAAPIGPSARDTEPGLTPPSSVTTSSGSGAEPDFGYSFGRFMMNALAIGVSTSIGSQGGDCNSR
jgi:hypothetical protein